MGSGHLREKRGEASLKAAYTSSRDLREQRGEASLKAAYTSSRDLRKQRGEASVSYRVSEHFEQGRLSLIAF